MNRPKTLETPEYLAAIPTSLEAYQIYVLQGTVDGNFAIDEMQT